MLYTTHTKVCLCYVRALQFYLGQHKWFRYNFQPILVCACKCTDCIMFPLPYCDVKTKKRNVQWRQDFNDENGTFIFIAYISNDIIVLIEIFSKKSVFSNNWGHLNCKKYLCVRFPQKNDGNNFSSITHCTKRNM